MVVWVIHGTALLVPRAVWLQCFIHNEVGPIAKLAYRVQACKHAKSDWCVKHAECGKIRGDQLRRGHTSLVCTFGWTKSESGIHTAGNASIQCDAPSPTPLGLQLPCPVQHSEATPH